MLPKHNSCGVVFLILTLTLQHLAFEGIKIKPPFLNYIVFDFLTKLREFEALILPDYKEAYSYS